MGQKQKPKPQGKPQSPPVWFVIEVGGKPYARPRAPGMGFTLGERPELLTISEAEIETKRLRDGGHPAETIIAKRWSAPVEALPPIKIPEVDLRNCTRGADRTESRVYLVTDDGDRKLWLKFGEAQLRWGEHNDRHQVAARMTEGVTDFEHDSVYAFQIPLIALELDRAGGVDYSAVRFTARISPEVSRFDPMRVPMGPYDPTKIEGAHQCDGEDDCKLEEPHLILPEGYFAGPPATNETQRLHKQLAGKRIEIVVGLPPRSEDES